MVGSFLSGHLLIEGAKLLRYRSIHHSAATCSLQLWVGTKWTTKFPKHCEPNPSRHRKELHCPGNEKLLEVAPFKCLLRTSDLIHLEKTLDSLERLYIKGSWGPSSCLWKRRNRKWLRGIPARTLSQISSRKWTNYWVYTVNTLVNSVLNDVVLKIEV